MLFNGAILLANLVIVPAASGLTGETWKIHAGFTPRLGRAYRLSATHKLN